jgi:hypothetical protein
LHFRTLTTFFNFFNRPDEKQYKWAASAEVRRNFNHRRSV